MAQTRVQRVHAEVIPNDTTAVAAVRRVGTATRIQTQERINRVATIARLTAVGADAISGVYGIAAEATEAGIHRLDRRDSLMARLGEDAAAEHGVTKDNLRRRLQQLAELAAGTLQDLIERDLEDLLSQPDSAFYDPSRAERFGAWFWDDTSIELQRRNLPRLTPRERLKQVFIGGVTDAKVAAYDRQQVAERRERLDLRQQLDVAQTHLAALATRNADLEALAAGAGPAAIGPGDDELASDEEMAAHLLAVEDLLRQVRGTAAADDPALSRRARGNRRTEAVDGNPVG